VLSGVLGGEVRRSILASKHRVLEDAHVDVEDSIYDREEMDRKSILSEENLEIQVELET